MPRGTLHRVFCLRWRRAANDTDEDPLQMQTTLCRVFHPRSDFGAGEGEPVHDFSSARFYPASRKFGVVFSSRLIRKLGILPV